MKKLLFSVLLIALSMSASATTFTPIQLLNPAGSVAGQVIVSSGPTTVAAWGGVGLSGIAAIPANTVLANATGSSVSPTAFSMPSCSTSASALNWTTSTGFTCNSAVNAATLGGTTFAAPGPIGSTTASTGKFTTLQATSAITPSSTAGIVGTATNDNANAGSVGEFLTNTTTATSLTSNTPANCTSVSLTAGDWDVSGTVQFNAAGSTTIQAENVGIGTTSATFGTFGTQNKNLTTFTTGATNAFSSPVTRVSIASTATAYLVAVASFGVSTMTCDGFIRARRVR